MSQLPSICREPKGDAAMMAHSAPEDRARARNSAQRRLRGLLIASQGRIGWEIPAPLGTMGITGIIGAADAMARP